MDKVERRLLLKDICSRLPYDLWVEYEGNNYVATGYGHGRVSLLPSVFSSVGGPYPFVEEVKPYLRPMSSMTEKEKEEFQAFHCIDGWHPYFYQQMCNIQNLENMFNWLNAHHFDFRNLIEKGLAIDCTNLNIY